MFTLSHTLSTAHPTITADHACALRRSLKHTGKNTEHPLPVSGAALSLQILGVTSREPQTRCLATPI